QQEAYDMGVSVGQALSSAFEDAVINGNSLGQVMANLAKRLADIALQAALFKPFEQMMGNAFSGHDLLKGVGGVFSLCGGCAGAAAGAVGGRLPLAKGGVFDTPDLKIYRNQIVNQPTFFRFAQGGVMGEAGSEAIMPLVRTPTGDLGVRTAGGGR